MVARAMSGRSYLSIGDVLSLLREEFPDVTISKIRFLESQGLVDPERSPSGYRKFYEGDVARLRWVLRKQRDQFLPLKVIRDRLAAAGSGVPPDDEPVADGDPAWQADPDLAPGAAAALREGAHAVVGAGRQVPNGTADDATWTVEADRDPGEVPALAAVHTSQAAGAAATAPRTPVAESTATGTAVSASRPATIAPVAADEARRKPQVEAPGARRGQPPAPAASTHATSGAAVSGAGAAEVLAPSVSGVSLTLGELCAATGLTQETVASLEGLGLLSSIPFAGGAFYDEEALTVGKLVVEFARYGVEPRHLRMYRNGVDREVGVIEQVITPLLRQRNPEARQRAVDAAADLARLGQSMRGSLIRSELRRQLGS